MDAPDKELSDLLDFSAVSNYQCIATSFVYIMYLCTIYVLS